MTKKIVVTGGAGFIGSNLVDYINLKSPDWKIIVVDDMSSGLESNLKKSDSTLVKESILNLDPLVDSSRGADAIVHLAAIGSVPRSIAEPRPTHEANTTGTLNVLEAARINGVKNVVVASSSSVYGSNPSLPRKETDWTRPLSPYAVSKLTTEAYACAYSAAYGLNTLAFRFFNVYGPRQRADHAYAAVIPRFISRALKQEPLAVFGDGNQSRDFTFVDSVCQALHLGCELGFGHAGPVNLAFGVRTTINGLIELLETEMGQVFEVDYHAPRPGDVYSSEADASLLSSLFPSASPTPLVDGLRKTLEWFSAEKN